MVEQYTSSIAIISENPNIGALGSAEYQVKNDRIKGFCPSIIHSPRQYLSYLEDIVLPLADKHHASRIIDRALYSKDPHTLSDGLANFGLSVEAAIPLGGKWENHFWIMVGTNRQGRLMTQKMKNAITDLANEAQRQKVEPVKSLPEHFKLETIKGVDLTPADFESLVEIFDHAFKAYLTPMTDPNYLAGWVNDESTLPYVIRNHRGEIVAVANADLAQMNFDNSDQTFKFMEIGDSATHPNYRLYGLNRIIKDKIIREGKRLGFDNVHTETRASWKSPNFGNAKNGMKFCGTLWNNCIIQGPEDVKESADPGLAEWARQMGSLNVWAISPNNPNWEHF